MTPHLVLINQFKNPYIGCDVFPVDSSAYECGTMAIINVFYDVIEYLKEAREHGKEGTVLVEFDIDANGETSNYRTVNDTLGFGLEQEALDATKAQEELGFYPAFENCVPVDYIYSFPITFDIL